MVIIMNYSKKEFIKKCSQEYWDMVFEEIWYEEEESSSY